MIFIRKTSGSTHDIHQYTYNSIDIFDDSADIINENYDDGMDGDNNNSEEESDSKPVGLVIAIVVTAVAAVSVTIIRRLK